MAAFSAALHFTMEDRWP